MRRPNRKILLPFFVLSLLSIPLSSQTADPVRSVSNANDELQGVFNVDWNQPAPDASGKKLIPNEVVHALIQHFDEIDLSNRSVPADALRRDNRFYTACCSPQITQKKEQVKMTCLKLNDSGR